jgi:pyruvate dehydrogenase E1 component
VREHFFGKHPKLLEMVSRMSDDDVWRLNRGGHDPYKVYAAFSAAVNHKGQPTVILAKTIKGYGMGHVGQAKNPSHQQKKLDMSAVREFRDRFNIPISDDKLEELPYFKPAEDSPEMQYLRERRKALGGSLPRRRAKADEQLVAPNLDVFKAVLEPTAEGREISTTQAFVRILNQILRDKQLSSRVVPILADESRTFGMEGLFRQIGIYAPEGQKYTPVDKDQVMYYRETADGQLLQEGINEAGAFSSWIAAATSYSSNNRIMIPFFIYYSMFGFQRIGDLAWAAGDMQARGFLLGGTAGRTTLNGEGLQHEDGHSHILSSMIPNCVSYDPTFAHELAVIIQDGLKRMVENQEDVYYYITVMNENYPQPGLTPGDEEGIIRGMYKLKSQGEGDLKVQLMGSGTILREVLAAQELLLADWGVASDVWSVTSFTELRRDGLDCERYSLLNPQDTQAPLPYVTQQLQNTQGPIVVSTDYVKAFGDQIRPYIPAGRSLKVLGTDGFGRSDFRYKLREHFEVDRHFVVLAALRGLADEGRLPLEKVSEAIQKYGINTNKANPHHA